MTDSKTDIVERLKEHLLGTALRGGLRCDVWAAKLEIERLRRPADAEAVEAARRIESGALQDRADFEHDALTVARALLILFLA